MGQTKDKGITEAGEGFIARYVKILVIVAVFCGASAGPIASVIDVPPLAIGFGRLTVALPFFVIPVMTKAEKRRELMELDRKTFLITVVTGIILFLHFFCFISCVKYTNVSVATVLNSFHPLVVLVLSVLVYKKRVPGKAIIAILIALAAGAYMACSDVSAFSDSRMTGNILALLAGIFMGFYFTVGGYARAKMDGSVYVMLIFFWCWLCFGIACIVTKTPLLGYTAKDYLGVVAMGIVCQLGSHALFNLCMGHVEPLYVSAWETMDPAASTVLAVVIAQQIPSVKEVVCCIIVVAALIAYSRFNPQGE